MPPPSAGDPVRTTVSGVDEESCRCSVSVTLSTPPFPSAVDCEPVTPTVNGGAGTDEEENAGVVVDEVVLPVPLVAAVAFFRASCARSAVEVPARRDQPG